MDKQRIIDNVTGLSAEQLFEQILCGNITLLELVSSSKINTAKRIKINMLQKQFELTVERDWETLSDSDNEAALKQYIAKYPTGKFVQLATAKLNQLEKVRLAVQAERNRILDALQHDPNAFRVNQVNDYLYEGLITKHDLLNRGIPAAVLAHLDTNPPNFHLDTDIETAPQGCTEVYFWGTSGAGKTGMLAALFHAADEAGYISPDQSNTSAYTAWLRQLFTDDIVIFPAPSPVESIKYLPFLLKKPGERNHRDISLVEVSGEILQCFYYANANKEMPSQTHKDTFDSLVRLLDSKNRKIHFFVIDYQQRNKKDSSGYIQSDYLQALLAFLHNKNILRKTTDAVYVLISKCDLMDSPPDAYASHSKTFLEEANFASFMNTLFEYCRKYSINEGKLYLEPISLGKFFFNHCSETNSHDVRKIIDILIDKVPVRRRFFTFN